MILPKMDIKPYLRYSRDSSLPPIFMDTKTKALILVMCVAVVVSITFLYYRSYISQDFYIDTTEQSE